MDICDPWEAMVGSSIGTHRFKFDIVLLGTVAHDKYQLIVTRCHDVSGEREPGSLKLRFRTLDDAMDEARNVMELFDMSKY